MPSDFPDIYSDQFQLSQGPYGVAMVFMRSPSQPTPNQQLGDIQGVVRMSLEHAKIMIMVMRKQLKQYELEHLGDSIKVPRNILDQMKLSEDDW